MWMSLMQPWLTACMFMGAKKKKGLAEICLGARLIGFWQLHYHLQATDRTTFKALPGKQTYEKKS